MKSNKILIILIFCFASIANNRLLLANPPIVDSFKLDNGIHITSLYIAGSKNVSIFTYVPMGLAWDGYEQTQWSHLVEHLVIRTTTSSGSRYANAETMADHMRLDFYGTVDNWQEGLSHHVRWLKGVPFTKENLQSGKLQVNSECDIVAKRLATHKVAFAAWAQGFRHGSRHAALKADVDKATLLEIQEYRDRYMVIPTRAVVCMIGGIDVQTLKPIIAEKLGSIRSNASLPKPVDLYHGNHEMTWDLDARHLMLTWPIPSFTEDDYPACLIASHLLSMKCFSDPELKKLTGTVLCGADLFTPEGTFFYISVSIRPEASSEDVRKKICDNLKTLYTDQSNPISTSMIGKQLSYQLSNLMDPAIVKAQITSNVSEAMIECNIGLQWGMNDFRYGSYRTTLAQKLTTTTSNLISHVIQKYLTDDNCTTCKIGPK